MKNYLLTAIIYFIVYNAFSQPSQIWETNFDTNIVRQTGQNLTIDGFCEDKLNNLYIVTQKYNGTDHDIYVIKFNSSGVIQWTRTYDSGNEDKAIGCGIDNSNNLYISGTGAGQKRLTMKYTGAGTLSWVQIYEAENCYTTAMHVTTTGAVYATGYYYTNSNNAVILTTRYSSTGSMVTGWPVEYDSNTGIDNIDQAFDMYITPSINIFITGKATGTGANKGLILKYNSSGTLLNEATFGNDAGTKITVNSDGFPFVLANSRIYKFNSTLGNVWNTGNTYTNITNINADYLDNIYILNSTTNTIIKLGHDGLQEWSKGLTYSGVNTNKVNTIITDSSSNIYAVGRFYDASNHWGSGAVSFVRSNGNDNWYYNDNQFSISTNYDLKAITARGRYMVIAELHEINSTEYQLNIQKICLTPVVYDLITSPDSICSQDTIFMELDYDPVTKAFSWTPSSFMNDTTIYNPYIIPENKTSAWKKFQYSVTLTGRNGCSISYTTPNFTVLPERLNYSSQSFCSGSSVTLDAGAGYINYQWSTTETTRTISVSEPGNYVVTVSTAACSVSDTIKVSYLSNLTTQIGITNVLCNGTATGALNVTVTNGSIPYTYSWSNDATTQSIVNLVPAKYYVTVSDNNGCSKLDSATITEPNLLEVSITGANATCHNICNATATALATGGTTPYTYNWNYDKGTDNIATALCPTIEYYITVTDANNCTAIASFIPNHPDTLTVSIISNVATCFNECNATATAIATGGTENYTYLWSDNNNTTDATIDNLCGNTTYTITITDANACTATANIVADQPTQITITFTSHDASCEKANGIAIANVIGGTGSYTYLWNTNATNDTIENLITATYTITVTDENNCSNTNSISINNMDAPSITIQTSNVNCFGETNGSATVTVNTGYAPYTYQWDDAEMQTTNVAENLGQGTYNVTVTDINNCITIGTVTITEPTQLQVTTITTNVLCYGSCNATATVSASGGVTNYSYSWEHTNENTNILDNLCANTTYYVTVTDNNGCQKISSFTPTQPDAISITLTKTNATCDLANGSALATVIGGVSPYEYIWNDSYTQITQTAINLEAGTYLVSVTDANNCSDTASILLINYGIPQITFTSENITCYGLNNGSATANVTMGVTPYTYIWNDNNSQTTNTITDLAAQTYIITVTDNSGCSIIDSVVITQPTELNITIESTNVTCYNQCNGSANVVAIGGTGAYTYLWSNELGTNQNVSGLCANITYTVTITDQNSCSIEQNISVTEPDELILTLFKEDGTCNIANGMAWVSVTGGTTPYEFVWTAAQQINDTITELAAGNYTVTITDANSCSKTGDITILNSGKPDVSEISISDITCYGLNNGRITTTVTGGSTPYTYQWDDNNSSTTQNIEGLAAGEYTLIVYDNLGCSDTAKASVTQPDELTITILATEPSQTGLCDGSATANVSGGTLAYTYLWNREYSTYDTINNLCAGTYSITVTDNNGCSVVKEITINEPPLAVKQFNNNELIAVYPNPNTNGIFYIKGLQSKNSTITITDATGKMVYTNQFLYNDIIILSIPNLASGVYYFKIINNDMQPYIQRVVIQNE